MRLHVPRVTEVEMPSGRYVDMKNPQPFSFTLEDVAHKLAQINRYAGSGYYPLSVAQHAVFVSRRIEQMGGDRNEQLAGLWHDGAEMFMMDIPKPLKILYGFWYAWVTSRFDKTIWQTFDLPLNPKTQTVKEADVFALYVEARHLLPSRGLTWRGADGRQWGAEVLPKRIITPDYWLGEIDWRQAKQDFLDRHEELIFNG